MRCSSCRHGTSRSFQKPLPASRSLLRVVVQLRERCLAHRAHLVIWSNAIPSRVGILTDHAGLFRASLRPGRAFTLVEGLPIASQKPPEDRLDLAGLKPEGVEPAIPGSGSRSGSPPPIRLPPARSGGASPEPMPTGRSETASTPRGSGRSTTRCAPQQRRVHLRTRRRRRCLRTCRRCGSGQTTPSDGVCSDR